MYSDVLMKMMSKERKYIASLLGKSKEEVLRLIYEGTDDEIKDIVYEVEDMVKSEYLTASKPRMKYLQELTNASSSLDVQHSFATALHFCLTEKAFGHEGNASELIKIPNEDILFDFRKRNYTIRISKNRYLLEVGNKFYPSYKGTLTVDSSCLSKEYFSSNSYCGSIQFDFVLEKMPRLFLDIGKDCINCGRCKTLNLMLSENNLVSPKPVLLCGKKNRVNSDCAVYHTVKLCTGYTLDELLNACFYALEVYNNRSKRKIDRSLNNGITIKHSTHTVRDYNSSNDFISIKEYRTYENRQKREYQGGHHSSPKEHYRKGYLRHYKSGKIVEVKPTVVNKGKEKSVYKL